MSRETTVQVRCDLCGHGGPLTRPGDFTSVDGVDLCKWCADPMRKTRLECGSHVVTFEDDSWSCTCGGRYRQPHVPSRVLLAVPSLLNATANVHVESPVPPTPDAAGGGRS